MPHHKFALIPSAVFLFILPFTHTIALRITALLLTFGIALWTWYRDPHPILPLKLPLSLWAGLAILSLLWSVDMAATFKEIKHEIIFCLMAFFSFFALTRTEKAWRFLLTILILSAATMAAVGVTSAINHGTWHTEGYQGGVGTFSTYVVTVIPFIVLFFMIANSWPSRLFTVLLIISLLYAVYMTLNRAVWPALIVEILVLCVMTVKYYKPISRVYRSGIALLAITIVAISISLFVDVTGAKDGQLNLKTIDDVLVALETDTRIPLWRDTLKSIEQRPILGYGFGQNTAKNGWKEAEYLPQYRHAHNIVLNYGLQLGTVGIITLIILFSMLLGMFFKMYRSNDRMLALLGLCAFSMTVGVLFKNFTDDFFRRDLALLYWSLAGMSLGYARWLTFNYSPANKGNSFRKNS